VPLERLGELKTRDVGAQATGWLWVPRGISIGAILALSIGAWALGLTVHESRTLPDFGVRESCERQLGDNHGPNAVVECIIRSRKAGLEWMLLRSRCAALGLGISSASHRTGCANAPHHTGLQSWSRHRAPHKGDPVPSSRRNGAHRDSLCRGVLLHQWVRRFPIHNTPMIAQAGLRTARTTAPIAATSGPRSICKVELSERAGVQWTRCGSRLAALVFRDALAAWSGPCSHRLLAGTDRRPSPSPPRGLGRSGGLAPPAGHAAPPSASCGGPIPARRCALAAVAAVCLSCSPGGLGSRLRSCTRVRGRRGDRGNRPPLRGAARWLRGDKPTLAWERRWPEGSQSPYTRSVNGCACARVKKRPPASAEGPPSMPCHVVARSRPAVAALSCWTYAHCGAAWLCRLATRSRNRTSRHESTTPRVTGIQNAMEAPLRCV
jgi:hypothetical protein